MAYAAKRPDTLAAVSDLRSYQFYHVMMDGSGTIALATGADSTAPIGILLNEPNTGEGCQISMPGELCQAYVADTCSAGNPVTIDDAATGGIENAATNADVVVGWATEDGVTGETITILTCQPHVCSNVTKLGYGL